MSLIAPEPLVSIGIPAYNRPEKLAALLEGLHRQTYTHLEILISDDQSPNPQVETVARTYLAKDPRARFIRQETNLGVIRSFEYLIRQATGSYFKCVADDDWISPDYIELTLAALQKEPEKQFCFGDIVLIDENDVPIPSHPQFLAFVQQATRLSREKIAWEYIYLHKPNRAKDLLMYSLFRRPFLVKCLDELPLPSKNLNSLAAIVLHALMKPGGLCLEKKAVLYFRVENPKFYSHKDYTELRWFEMAGLYLHSVRQNLPWPSTWKIRFLILGQIVRKYHRPKYLFLILRELFSKWRKRNAH